MDAERFNPEGAPTPRTFSSLAEAARVTVHFTSRGCFHAESFKFEFTAGAPPRVELFEPRRRGPETVFRSLGELALTREDLRRLDGLLAAYGSDPEGACTTADFVDVTWHEDGDDPAKESFVDISSAIFDTDECLRLDSLASRLSPDGPRESRAPADFERIGPGVYVPPRKSPTKRKTTDEDITQAVLHAIEEIPNAREHARELTRVAVENAAADPCVHSGVWTAAESERCQLSFALWHWIHEELLCEPYPPAAASIGEYLRELFIGSILPVFFGARGLCTVAGISEQDLLSIQLRKVDWDVLARRCFEEL